MKGLRRQLQAESASRVLTLPSANTFLARLLVGIWGSLNCEDALNGDGSGGCAKERGPHSGTL